MRFSELPEAVRVLWAKSGEPQGHGLLAHMLDVAAAAEVLLQHEPRSTVKAMARQFGLGEDVFIRFAAALVGLHDFGKSIAGFQAKWPQGQARAEAAGLKFSKAALNYADHAAASAALLPSCLCSTGVALSWVRGALQGISAHHGYNLHVSEINGATYPFKDESWAAVRQELFVAYWQTVQPQGVPTGESLPISAVEWLAGLTSVADWIGSNVDWFPMGERADSLVEHYSEARSRAEEALKQIGWASAKPLLTEEYGVDSLIARVVGRAGLAARPLQVEGDRLLSTAKGPTLLLVEAPMGEGKTELAFLAHLRLQAGNTHRGLYVALPTQATGNAMFDRALAFLRAFGEQQRLDIQLVHGGAMLDERVQRLRGIYGERKDDVSSSAWFSQRRRPLLSPYGVGTIDQALFATLNVKHHFVRLWGLANRVVVLDEVHAYDTYTSGLIEALLRWLKALGSSVVLMSATLPEAKRRSLMAAWGVDAEQVPELPYPRLVMVDARGVQGETFAARPLPSISLHAVEEGVEALAQCALQLLENGGHGAVIVNTVDRAQKLYRQLQPLLGADVRLMLFHARYPADERGQLERDVLAAFGQSNPSAQRAGRALLIATQVVEQSLDIDFDFLITDLAPVDLVLQRAGRLHRHQRTRPAAHTQARLHVAGLAPEQLPELKSTAWEFVYDPYILGRTWALLSRESVLNLPGDIDRLVQAVYGDDPLPDDLDAEALAYITQEAYGKRLAHEKDERQKAINIAVDAKAEPQLAYLPLPRGSEEGEGLGLVNKTRLGDDAITVVPVYAVEGGWSVTPAGESFDPQQPVPDGLARRLYGRQLKINRKGLVAHFAGVTAPPAFTEHPLLRHLKPMLLSAEGFAVAGDWRVQLDQELGLTYGSNTSTEGNT